MQIGIVGLGRMGMNMAKRLLKNGHNLVAYNRSVEKIHILEADGAIASESLSDFVDKLEAPRVVWLMLPVGKIVEQHIDALIPLLEKGDIIIDGGNSFYKDDIIRFEKLKTAGINYVDVGVSGGIWGLENGYCLMIGGDEKIFKYIEPVCKALAPENGYLYCGPAGAGHFVKMVHNGIEYALMESYAEGFEIMKESPYDSNLNYSEVCNLWNRGSVIKSWLLELAALAFEKDPDLSGIKGYVEDSGEGRWTVMQAIESDVSAPVIALSLFKRFQSRKDDLFSDKVNAALRKEFGGHKVKQAE
ncbi:MAG: phosphogluconate dehydrogenase (NAD(+)-dependent, decarboxylating) [Cyanobacteriota bacterium]